VQTALRDMLEGGQELAATKVHGRGQRPRCFGSCEKFHFCDKPWVSGFTSKEATAPCGRLVMLLDHVFTRDVTVSTSTRIERKSRDV
jgi:hypothetical protein